VRDDGAGGSDTAQLLIRDAEGQHRGARRLVRAVVSPDDHRPHNLEIDTSHFFTDLTSKADTEISKLYEEAGGALFGAAGPLPQPTTDSSSNTDSLVLTDTGALYKFLQYASGAWLLDKIKSYLPDMNPTARDTDMYPTPTPTTMRRSPTP